MMTTQAREVHTDDEFSDALRDTPIGSILVDDDRDVYQYLGDGMGRVLYASSATLRIGWSIDLCSTVCYPVTIQPMGSVEPASVLDYLTRIWEDASVPEDDFIPAGAVAIHKNDDPNPDYTVWSVLTDLPCSHANIRIVSGPPHKVGFYLQAGGYAYYWDGSVWSVRKGGIHCNRQDYEFSQYIGDVKEDK